MKLLSFSCNRFAGLINTSIAFEDGLNIVLGPNEAGKTTIVEGIFAALFKDCNIKMNTKQGRSFMERFKPFPAGDSFEATVAFEVDGKEYKLDKEWGSSAGTELNAKGIIYKDQAKIKEILADLLQHGENTYQRIVFAKQKEFREVLERISEDKETIQNLGDLLREAVMELGGVSVEGLKRRILEEHKRLSGQWDIINRRPKGMRELDNPWIKNVGSVLENYYAKEKLSIEMKKAEELEAEFSDTVEELKKIQSEKKNYQKLIEAYSDIEGDITKRARIEPQIKMLTANITELNQVAQEFPVKKIELKLAQKELLALKQEREELNQELDQAEALQRAKADQEVLIKYEKKESERKELLPQLNNLQEFTAEKIEEITKLTNRKEKIRASIAAATLQGELLFTDGKVEITRGLAATELLDKGASFIAEGCILLKKENTLEIKIKAGTIDFEKLKTELLSLESIIKASLNQLNVEDLTEAKRKQAEYSFLANRIKQLEGEIATLLGGKDVAAIQEKVNKVRGLQTRSIAVLKEKQEDYNQKINQIEIKLATLQEKIKQWQDKYQSAENVIHMLSEKNSSLITLNQELERLATLPVDFKNAEDFQQALFLYRKKNEELSNAEKEIQYNYYQLETQLPETTFEELKKQFEWAEELFQREEKKLKTLLKVKQKIDQVLKDRDQDSFQPLEVSFSKYLNLLTHGDYKGGKVRIKEKMEIIGVKKDGTIVPIELFSAGTYDCVSLALRFALMEYLFKDRNHLLILDDCLVNLDPQRTKAAVSLIEEFANNNQVLLFTCKPETASLFAGKLIKVEK